MPPDAGQLLLFGTAVSVQRPGAGACRRRRHGASGAGVLREPVGRREPLPRRAAVVARISRSRARCGSAPKQMLAAIGAQHRCRAQRVGELTTGQQQMLQIASAVGTGARVIVFDEPTSSLSQHEAEKLYELIDRLRARGVTSIYVSHRMEEIFRLCDTVTVLRDGTPRGDAPDRRADAAGAGADDDRPAARGVLPVARSRADRATSCCGSSSLSSPGQFHDVSFTLRAGEVLGFAGLVGAGPIGGGAGALRPRSGGNGARARSRQAARAVRPAARDARRARPGARRIASGRAWCCR